MVGDGWWGDGQHNGTRENYPPLNPPPPKLKRKKMGLPTSNFSTLNPELERKKTNSSLPPNLKGIKARHLRPSYWLKGK
jgi:hypothetical protein